MAARIMARQGCGRSSIPAITRPMCSIPTATMWRSATSPGFTNKVCAAHAPSRRADTPDWCIPRLGSCAASRFTACFCRAVSRTSVERSRGEFATEISEGGRMRAGSRLDSWFQVPGRVEGFLIFVFVGEDGGLGGPMDVEFGVVVAETAFVFGGVELVYEVEGFGVGGEGEEAVGETFGDVEHAAVF